MSTTVNVVCYKSKVLKYNELSLMIRVCKDRKLIGRGAASTKG